MISISDKTGRIRTDFEEAELAELNEAQMAALAAVVHAAQEADDAEKADREAETTVAQCAKKLSDAEAAYRESLPKWTALDEMRRTSEQHRRIAQGLKPLPPREADGDTKLAAKVKKAEAALDAARTRGYEAKNDLRSKRGTLAEALTVWANSHAKTPEQHIREHLARQQQIAAQVASGEIKTAPEAKPSSHLDSVLMSGAKRGHNAANHGFGRNYAKRTLR